MNKSAGRMSDKNISPSPPHSRTVTKVKMTSIHFFSIIVTNCINPDKKDHVSDYYFLISNHEINKFLKINKIKKLNRSKTKQKQTNEIYTSYE